MPANCCTAAAASRRSASRSIVHAARSSSISRELLARHRRAAAAALGLAVLERAFVVGVAVGVVALGRHAGAEQREVHVEDGLERALVALVLHQRRAEHGLEHRRGRRSATCSTARIASRFSVIDTGSPAVRSSWTNPWRTSSSEQRSRGAGVAPETGMAVLRPQRRGVGHLQLLAGLGDVGLVLEQHVQRLADHLGVDLGLPRKSSVRAQSIVSEIDGAFFRSSSRIERTTRAICSASCVVDLGHAHPHDLLLALDVGVVDVQVEAAPLQRLRQLTGVVRREEHDRPLRALDRAELGDRHLEVGEHLEQQRLGLDLDPVDLVDEQHDRLLGADRLEQRTGEQERLGEDVGLDVLPVGVVLPVGLDAQQLLLVVPLVERLGLVETLVALQADQPGAGDLGDAPWPARSCRRRPGPRRAPASRAGRRGTRRRRCRCRRGSRRSRRRSVTSSTDSNRSAMRRVV